MPGGGGFPTPTCLIPTYSGDVLDRFFNALENFQESPATLARLREPAVMQAAANLLRED